MADYKEPQEEVEKNASLNDLRQLLREVNQSLDLIVEKLRELNYTVRCLIGEY